MGISGKKMAKEALRQKKAANEFEKFIVAEYLKHRSVDEMFRANAYNLPVSYSGVYHILERRGVVRAIGRANTPLSECIGFLVRMVEEKIPLETLYKRMPHNFAPSAYTLHTVYRKVKKEVKKQIKKRDMRRVGTALIITPEDSSKTFLIGRDVATPRLDVGKPYGAISLPMGFSKRGEREKAILRVLQQEVFSKKLIDDLEEFLNITENIVKDPRPFMYLDIADVRVSVYHLKLPQELSGLHNFFSFRLKNYRFTTFDKIIAMSKDKNLLREGMFEMAEGYVNYQKTLESAESGIRPIYKTSFLNRQLALLASRPDLSQESV